jgi:hypothetical protein
MKFTRSTKTLAAFIVASLAAGFIGGGLLSQDAESAKRHSARWHVHVFKEAAQGREFDQFLGSEFRYKDAAGKAITVACLPGKVVKLAVDSITLQLNDGSAPKDFSVKADTEDARDVAAQVRHLDIGSRALVITVNGESKYVVELAGRDAPERPKAEKKDAAPKAKKAEKAEKAAEKTEKEAAK